MSHPAPAQWRTNVSYSEKARRLIVKFVPSRSTPVQSSPAWPVERRVVRAGPAARDDERHEPQDRPGREPDRAADERRRRPAACAIEERRARAAAASARAPCDLKPKAIAATKAPTRIRRPDSAMVARVVRPGLRRPRRQLPHQRRRQDRLRRQRNGQAGRVAHRPRRGQPRERGRERERRGHGGPSHPLPEAQRRRRDRRPAWASRRSTSRQPKSRSSANADSAPNSTPQIASACGSLSTVSAAFAERHVDRIAGRVRAMPAGIEVAEAEGEVRRVDVFERRREERQVAEREEEREDGRDPPRPGPAPHRCQQVDHGQASDRLQDGRLR